MESNIYKITNRINKKVYIGKTTRDINIRFKEHVYDSKLKNYLLHRAIRKYSQENFILELIESVNDNISNEREIYWIKFYDSSNPVNGYNITIGGEGASPQTVVIKNENGEIYRISSLEFHSNRKDYKTLSDNKVTCLDVKSNKYVQIDKNSYYSNKNNYIHATENTVPVKDNEGNNIRVSKDEYNKSRELYHTHSFGNVYVFDKTLNKKIKVSSEEYNLNHDRYETYSKNKVVAIIKDSKERVMIDKDEFHNNRNLYLSINEGKIFVFDSILNKRVMIYPDKFDNTRHITLKKLKENSNR